MVPAGGTAGRFADRADAGSQLAEAVLDRDIDADVVLAIPRGVLPVGREVADALVLPLDIVVSAKLGAPGNPEFSIGAVASDGSVWLDEGTIDRHDIDETYIDQERQRRGEYARAKADRYRGDRTPPAIDGRTVVVVDDGVATGSTAMAAVRLLRGQGARRIVLAFPVGPADTVRTLQTEADEVVCLKTPDHFTAVGQFYHRFGQVSDEETMAYLDPDGR